MSLNESQIEKEAIYDGFYMVCTSLESPIEEIIKINKRRWEIKETFRILKNKFLSHPIYLQRETRIKAHFSTCFLSLLTFCILEKKLNDTFTCPELISKLKEMKMLEIDGEDYVPPYTRTNITDALHEAFGFRTGFEILPQKR
ncbi:hypothetical protein KQI76_05320 [Amphibacillus sp. MSJ-3]|uniref:hypothetical protein n=1 Tax=Amphibacillus sp. MSJ-3 TaxID=2841505 RepID=UPI001C0EE312|nr:hypothetical protein [Amphibacillus sp. MSJ-3]MBU5594576.1 hypothetical protein [Amphibacillus sp. MSJ-3]